MLLFFTGVVLTVLVLWLIARLGDYIRARRAELMGIVDLPDFFRKAKQNPGVPQVWVSKDGLIRMELRYEQPTMPADPYDNGGMWND
jgi:hypothetical protein